TVAKKVMSMYTDPNHIRVEDPGQVEGNTVFCYLDVFDPDGVKVQELKEHYRRGGLGDVKIKRYLIDVLNNFLDPIRKRRIEFSKNRDFVTEVLKAGTEKVEAVASHTMHEVRQAIKIDYF